MAVTPRGRRSEEPFFSLIVNMSPIDQTLFFPVERQQRKLVVPPFGVIRSDERWQELLRPQSTKGGNQDPHHPWDKLRFFDLGIDLVDDKNFKLLSPEELRSLDDEGLKRYRARINAAPIDKDKLAQHFNPSDARHDWDPVLEPRGIATITEKQAEFWMMNYGIDAERHLIGYMHMLANEVVLPDGSKEKGSRNDAMPFCQNVLGVRAFCEQRRIALENERNNSTGIRQPRLPFGVTGSRRANQLRGGTV